MKTTEVCNFFFNPCIFANIPKHPMSTHSETEGPMTSADGIQTPITGSVASPSEHLNGYIHNSTDPLRRILNTPHCMMDEEALLREAAASIDEKIEDDVQAWHPTS